MFDKCAGSFLGAFSGHCKAQCESSLRSQVTAGIFQMIPYIMEFIFMQFLEVVFKDASEVEYQNVFPTAVLIIEISMLMYRKHIFYNVTAF